MSVAGDRALPLLDDVGQLVREGVPVTASIADDHMAAGGVRPGTDLGGRGPGGCVGVQAHVGEVRAETCLHVGTRRVVEGTPAGAQHVVDGGALDRRLFSMLVAAARAVLMLLLRPGVSGLPEQLDDGGVADGALQGKEGHGSAARCGRGGDRSAGG